MSHHHNMFDRFRKRKIITDETLIFLSMSANNNRGKSCVGVRQNLTGF